MARRKRSSWADGEYCQWIQWGTRTRNLKYFPQARLLINCGRIIWVWISSFSGLSTLRGLRHALFLYLTWRQLSSVCDNLNIVNRTWIQVVSNIYQGLNYSRNISFSASGFPVVNTNSDYNINVFWPKSSIKRTRTFGCRSTAFEGKNGMQNNIIYTRKGQIKIMRRT